MKTEKEFNLTINVSKDMTSKRDKKYPYFLHVQNFSKFDTCARYDSNYAFESSSISNSNSQDKNIVYEQWT